MKTLQEMFPKTKIATYSNNETYNVMVEFISQYACDSIKVETFNLTSWVTTGGSNKAYNSEACSISLPDHSHLNFKSFGNKVDISRIISNNKGNGRILMLLVLSAYFYAVSKVTNPAEIILECVGSVGIGSNKRDMPVSHQTAFFRKFGFRKYGKYNPNHIHMNLGMNDDTKKTLDAFQNLV